MSDDHTEALNAAARVLNIEAEALSELSRNLPKDFAALCDAILACKGRVIVAGIGKSGHIARKISATLASTGTPSYFLHHQPACR